MGPGVKTYPSVLSNQTFHVFGIQIQMQQIYILAITIILMLALQFIVRKTKIGRSMRAVSVDADAAKLMGINVSVVVALTFMISGALAAVAGIFCGVNYILYPQLNQLVFKGMIASILGGLGNISGALYGGIMLAF